MSYKRELLEIANDFFAHQPEATADEIADWAIRTRRWAPPEDTGRKRLANEISRAMAEDKRTDRQGRIVRGKHAARMKRNGRQMVLWSDLDRASRDFMDVAFKQRRKQIVGDCRQLKVDVDSYNDNSNPGEPIQIPFDFTKDLAEIEALRKVEAA